MRFSLSRVPKHCRVGLSTVDSMAPKEKKKSKEKTKTFSEKEAPQKAQRRSSGSKKGAGNEAVAFFDASES